MVEQNNVVVCIDGKFRYIATPLYSNIAIRIKFGHIVKPIFDSVPMYSIFLGFTTPSGGESGMGPTWTYSYAYTID